MAQEVTIQSPIQFLQREDVKAKFVEIMGNRGNAYVTSVLTLVNATPKLKSCTAGSVYQCAITAATLDLAVHPSLGFAYLVPYHDNKKDIDVCTFMISWKGLIQLAQRTGQFQSISACPVYKGQVVSQNPLDGFVFDWNAIPESRSIPIGYAAKFKLLNGFEKTSYMTHEEVIAHAKKYSKTFGNANGVWATNFEAMALKTVLKLLMGKFAPLSIEMQRAIIADQAEIQDAETMDVDYIDNGTNPVLAQDAKQDAATSALKSTTTKIKAQSSTGQV